MVMATSNDPAPYEPGAKYVTGKTRPEGNRWSLDKSYSGIVMFGFHAMEWHSGRVLCHTQSSASENRYWYNGIESGELAQTASVAGYFGVPPILVQEMKRHAGKRENFRDGIVTVATKEGWLAKQLSCIL